MQKNLSTIKKIIFGFLMFYMICGLTFFFVLICSSFSFVSSFVYDIGWDYHFYNDGIILPYIIFMPEAFVIAAIVWIFFRKETSVLSRGIITAVPFWQIISLFTGVPALSYNAPIELKFLNILTIAVFFVIYFFLFRELIRLFRKS